jgi:hypothetical protein
MTMVDLRERFRAADQIPVADLMASVRQRLDEPDDGTVGRLQLARPLPVRRAHDMTLRKLLTIAAALAITAAPITFLVRAFESSQTQIPGVEPGRVIATIPVPGLSAVAAGEGGVWVTSVSGGAVSMIDPATDQIEATIVVSRPEHGPWDVAVGEGGVWVVVGPQTHHSQVVRIDPATDRIVARIDVPDATVIETGLGAVWVGQSSGGEQGHLVRIDPSTDEVAASIPVGPESSGLAIGGGSVWVLDDRSYEIRKVDPSANTSDVVFEGASDQSELAWGIAYDGRAVWTVVCARTGPPMTEPSAQPGCEWSVVRIDAGSFETTSIPVATESQDAGNTLHNVNTSVVAAADGSVWVTIADASPVHDNGDVGFSNGRLIRVGTDAMEVVGSVTVGANLVGDVAIVGGDLWGATWGASSREAVLRVRPAP